MEEFTLAVVGIDWNNGDKAKTNRRFELLMSLPGEPVQLRPEPRNKHDEHAVAVFSARGIQVGYLSAERAPWIGRRLRSGEDAKAVFQGIAGSAAFIRIRFGGGVPVLPPVTAVTRMTKEPAGDVFFPDADGPDWGA